MGEVVRISDQAGPPASDFERDAVEQLLSSIRKFRGDVGYEPHGLVYVLVADGNPLHFRCGHMRHKGPSDRMFYSFASAALVAAAIED